LKKIGDGYVEKEVEIINNGKKDIILDEADYDGDDDNEDSKNKTPVPFGKPIKILLSDEKKAVYRNIMDITPKPKHFTLEEVDKLKEVFDIQKPLPNAISRTRMYDALKLQFDTEDFDMAPQTIKPKK